MRDPNDLVYAEMTVSALCGEHGNAGMRRQAMNIVNSWEERLLTLSQNASDNNGGVPTRVNVAAASGPGKLVQSGKVLEKPSFPGIADLIIGFGDTKSIVVGCAWNLVEGSVYFTVDGAQLTPPD